jgi:hypothetical protein
LTRLLERRNNLPVVHERHVDCRPPNTAEKKKRRQRAQQEEQDYSRRPVGC